VGDFQDGTERLEDPPFSFDHAPRLTLRALEVDQTGASLG